MRCLALLFAGVLAIAGCTTQGDSPSGLEVRMESEGDPMWILDQSVTESGICLEFVLMRESVGSRGVAVCDDEPFEVAYYRDGTEGRRFVWGRVADPSSEVGIVGSPPDAVTSSSGEDFLLFVIETDQDTSLEVLLTAPDGTERTVRATRPPEQ